MAREVGARERPSSPHARRSFRGCADGSYPGGLFSARAEVIPPCRSMIPITSALLRTRGGHSKGTLDIRAVQDSSPHARRSFLTPGGDAASS